MLKQFIYHKLCFIHKLHQVWPKVQFPTVLKHFLPILIPFPTHLWTLFQAFLFLNWYSKANQLLPLTHFQPIQNSNLPISQPFHPYFFLFLTCFSYFLSKYNPIPSIFLSFSYCFLQNDENNDDEGFTREHLQLEVLCTGCGGFRKKSVVAPSYSHAPAKTDTRV